MKLSLPLTYIPSVSFPIEPIIQLPPVNYYVTLENARIGFCPLYIDDGFSHGSTSFTGSGRLMRPAEDFLVKSYSELAPVKAVPVDAYHQTEKLYRQMQKTRRINFFDPGEFLYAISYAINHSMQLNRIADETLLPPQFEFEINTDNTFSLLVNPQSTDVMIPWGANTRAYTNADVSAPGNILGKPLFWESLLSQEETPSGNIAGGFIVATEPIANATKILPWVRFKNDNLVNDPEPYLYFLDTRTANVIYPFNSIKNYNAEMDQNETLTANFGSSHGLRYTFPSSDAVSLYETAALLLTMSDAAFSQQVFPVNFTPTTMSAAQTTVVPILDSYIPNLQRPSDFTAELLVIREDFSNAAPIKITPALLKSRDIIFKVWRVTKDGKMYPVTIPPSSAFYFQLCFELWPFARYSQ